MINPRPRFLTPSAIQTLAKETKLPVYIYDETTLHQSITSLIEMPSAYGMTVRFAMKACPTRYIIQTINRAGIHIDASSEYEAYRAIAAGIAPHDILLTAQELANGLVDLVSQGVQFTACSLHQLEAYGKAFPHTDVSVRINPGVGSGETNRVNVGGISSGFGIWYEYIDRIHDLCKQYDLTIKRVHSHIGCGTDPNVRHKVASMNLETLRAFPSATILNLGGGFKVGRMPEEKTADLSVIGAQLADQVRAFAHETGREIHIEIEPGTYLMANAGSIVAEIMDIVDTGHAGFRFLKLNTGMTEIVRPMMYGSQHPISIVYHPDHTPNPDSIDDYLVIGHCCESGDMLTVAPGDPEGLSPRFFVDPQIGDWVVIDGAGAYCSGMSTSGYNSFPQAAEIFLHTDGSMHQIRARADDTALWERDK